MKFSVKEITKYLNCSESSIRKLVKTNEIPYFRVATKILFDKDTIDEWVRTISNKVNWN